MSAVGDPIAGDGAWPTAVAVTTVGGRPVLVSGHKSIFVRVWDLAAGTRIGDRLGPGGRDFVTAVRAFAAGGRAWVMVGTYEGTMQAWDLTTGATTGTPQAIG